jgi:hypothetical protein
MGDSRRYSHLEYYGGAMSTEEREVSLPLAAAIELFRDMEEFVVSLDRIRSRIAFGQASPHIMMDYMVEREMFQRLAKARRVLSDLLEPVIGEEALEEIAEDTYVYPTSPQPEA